MNKTIVGQVGPDCGIRFLWPGRQPEGRVSRINMRIPSAVSAVRAFKPLPTRSIGDTDRFCGRGGCCGHRGISQLPYYVRTPRWGTRMGHKVFGDVIQYIDLALRPYHNKRDS